MLPGKKYTPEDLLTILRRRAWMVLVPFAVVSAGTAIVVRRLPNLYRSEATIVVVGQQIPEAYVKSGVTTRIDDRVGNIQQTIESRTRLENLIEEFNLYPAERRTGIMQDVVEQMKRDIRVEFIRSDVFNVIYIGPDARTVKNVAERLGSQFIQENTTDRASLTEGTNQFLDAQLNETKQQLKEKEAALQQYKLDHSGQLPSQLEANLQSLGSVQVQIQNVLEIISRSDSEKLFVNRQLAALQDDADASAAAAASGANPEPSGTPTEQQLEHWKAVLAQLKAAGKGDAHPDVKETQRQIKNLTAQLDRESQNRPVSDDKGVQISPADKVRNQKIQDFKDQKALLETKIAQAQAEEKNLRAIAASYKQKIDNVPARESEMVELTRDYATLQASYTSLLGKKQEANLTTNLERKAVGEQFRLLDSATVPERPISPNRPLMNLLGMVVGLGIGLGLVVLVEYKDTSFKTDDEVTRLLALPVLAVVPVMESEEEQSRNLRRRLLVGIGLGATVVGCLAILAYTFVR